MKIKIIKITTTDFSYNSHQDDDIEKVAVEGITEWEEIPNNTDVNDIKNYLIRKDQGHRRYDTSYLILQEGSPEIPNVKIVLKEMLEELAKEAEKKAANELKNKAAAAKRLATKEKNRVAKEKELLAELEAKYKKPKGKDTLSFHGGLKGYGGHYGYD